MRKERHNHLTSGVTVLKFHLPAANERREYAEIFHIVANQRKLHVYNALARVRRP